MIIRRPLLFSFSNYQNWSNERWRDREKRGPLEAHDGDEREKCDTVSCILMIMIIMLAQDYHHLHETWWCFSREVRRKTASSFGFWVFIFWMKGFEDESDWGLYKRRSISQEDDDESWWWWMHSLEDHVIISIVYIFCIPIMKCSFPFSTRHPEMKMIILMILISVTSSVFSCFPSASLSRQKMNPLLSYHPWVYCD